MIEGIIAAIIGVFAGVGGTFAYDKQRKVGSKHKADQSIAEAKTKANNLILKAQEDALRLVDEAKREESDRRKSWDKTETRLAERETNLDKKLDELEKRWFTHTRR
jgi:ribonuclease Y